MRSDIGRWGGDSGDVYSRDQLLGASAAFEKAFAMVKGVLLEGSHSVDVPPSVVSVAYWRLQRRGRLQRVDHRARLESLRRSNQSRGQVLSG